MKSKHVSFTMYIRQYMSDSYKWSIRRQHIWRYDKFCSERLKSATYTFPDAESHLLLRLAATSSARFLHGVTRAYTACMAVYLHWAPKEQDPNSAYTSDAHLRLLASGSREDFYPPTPRQKQQQVSAQLHRAPPPQLYARPYLRQPAGLYQTVHHHWRWGSVLWRAGSCYL